MATIHQDRRGGMQGTEQRLTSGHSHPSAATLLLEVLTSLAAIADGLLFLLMSVLYLLEEEGGFAALCMLAAVAMFVATAHVSRDLGVTVALCAVTTAIGLIFVVLEGEFSLTVPVIITTALIQVGPSLLALALSAMLSRRPDWRSDIKS